MENEPEIFPWPQQLKITNININHKVLTLLNDPTALMRDFIVFSKTSSSFSFPLKVIKSKTST